MPDVKLNIKDWGRYLARLGQRAHTAMERGLVAGGQRCVALMQKRGDEAVAASQNGQPGAFNTGGYRRSWHSSPIPRGVRIYNSQPYSGVIDRGRRAGGFPPLRVIQQWAMRRLGLSAKEAKAAAYPIARAIARRGLRPRGVMSGAVVQMKELVQGEIERELETELRR